MAEQGQHRTPYHWLIADTCRDQVGRPDRQPQRVAHNGPHDSGRAIPIPLDTPLFGPHCQRVVLNPIAGAQNSGVVAVRVKTLARCAATTFIMTAGLGLASVGGATVAAAQSGRIPELPLVPRPGLASRMGDNWDGGTCHDDHHRDIDGNDHNTTSGASRMVGFRPCRPGSSHRHGITVARRSTWTVRPMSRWWAPGSPG